MRAKRVERLTPRHDRVDGIAVAMVRASPLMRSRHHAVVARSASRARLPGLAAIANLLIVAAYGVYTEIEMSTYRSVIVLVDEYNRPGCHSFQMSWSLTVPADPC
jgi:hypothetical protein